MSIREDLKSFLEQDPKPAPKRLKTLCKKLSSQGSLSWQEMAEGILLLIEGSPPEEERLAFLRDLRPEKATGEMLAAASGVLRELAPSIPFEDEVVFDCVGTGGDRLGLYNISTLAAIVVAACGVAVAKHGNRAITSACGSADILAALNAPIEVTPEEAAASLKKNRITFLFAPLYHEATKNVQPLRLALKEEGIPTLFNLIGPLSNPANPTHLLVGVYDPVFLRPMAEALLESSCRRAWVVSGSTGRDGWMDEVSLCGPTSVVEIKDGRLKETTVTPEDFGLEPVDLDKLIGGDANRNTAAALGVFNGIQSPLAGAVCMNAAVGLYLTGQAEDLQAAFERAKTTVTSGKAMSVLNRWAS